MVVSFMGSSFLSSWSSRYDRTEARTSSVALLRAAFESSVMRLGGVLVEGSMDALPLSAGGGGWRLLRASVRAGAAWRVAGSGDSVQPGVAGVDKLKRIYEPAPADRIELRQHCREVSLVLWPVRVFGFEEQDDLGPAIRDAFLCPFDHLDVGQLDPFIPAADPDVAVGRFAKDVEPPAERRGVPHPRLLMPVESCRCLSEWPDEPRVGQISVRDEELEPGESLERSCRSDPAARQSLDLRALFAPDRGKVRSPSPRRHTTVPERPRAARKPARDARRPRALGQARMPPPPWHLRGSFSDSRAPAWEMRLEVCGRDQASGGRG